MDWARSPRFHSVLALGVVFVAALATYGWIVDLGHLGWDTLPLILTSRVDGAGAFVDNFTKVMMDGRYPLGEFYRPVTNLTLAANWAAGGIDALGYHVTDLTVLLGGAVGIYLLSARLFRPGLLPLIAALSFVLHPAHFEAIPITARRADYLSLMFTLLALCAVPRPGSPILGRRAWACAALTLMALSSKETGLVCFGVVFALSLCEAAGRPLERLLGAIRISALPFAALVLFVATRTLVLGGIGGHEESSLLDALWRMPGVLRAYGEMLLLPQPLFDAGWMNRALASGAAAALIGASVLLMLSPGAASTDGPRRAAASLAFLCIWLGGLVFVTSISGERQAWYAVPFLPVHSLVFAFVAAGAIDALRARRWWVAGPVVGAALLLSVAHLRYSGLVHDYVEWHELSWKSRLFLERVRKEAVEANGGQVRVVRGLPEWESRPPGTVAVRGAAGLSDYSVQAWAELALPERPVRVIDGRRVRGTLAARPGEILVAVLPPGQQKRGRGPIAGAARPGG